MTVLLIVPVSILGRDASQDSIDKYHGAAVMVFMISWIELIWPHIYLYIGPPSLDQIVS